MERWQKPGEQPEGILANLVVQPSSIEEIAEEVFIPEPVFKVPQLPPLEFSAPVEDPSDHAGGSTVTIVAQSSAPGEPVSRLAHRFAPTAPPTLVSIFPEIGIRYELSLEQTLTIGRDPRRSDLVLFNPSVSQKHCQVVVDDEECTLIDLGSTNGTFVNGERLSSSRILRQGDLVTIGRFVFVFLWFRFAPAAQPEMLHYDGLRATFSRLYPTPASIQTLLLASNLFNLPVDITRGTIDQIWERVLSGLKRQDFFPSLRNLTHASLREHPDSSELLRLQSTLGHWDAMRQERGVQERVNIDVKNSMLLVREILGHHTSAEEEETPANMDLEDAEPSPGLARTPGSITPLADGRNTARSNLLPPDLPFELKPDESSFNVPIQIGVKALPPETQRETPAAAKPEGLSLPPVTPAAAPVAPAPVTATPSSPATPASAASASTSASAAASASTSASAGASASTSASASASTSELPKPVERETPSADRGTAPAPIQTPPLPASEEALPPPAPLGGLEMNDPLMPPPPTAHPKRAESKAEPPPPVPVTSRTDLAADPLTGMPENPLAAKEAAPWDNEAPPAPSRPRWLMPAATAALIALGAYLLPSLFSDPTANMAAAPDQVADASGAAPPSELATAPGSAESSGKTAEATGSEAATTSAEAGKTASTGADAASDASPTASGASPTASGGEVSKGADSSKPVEGAPATASTKPTPGVPVKPGFSVINFLGDDEKPKYTSETSPAGAGWDDKTGQIPASNLKDCQWVGNRTAIFQSKGGKTFRFVQCTTGQALVEGWVVEAGMKNK
ncbi:MAG: FHA domain-containing protein [Myxococcota bacterium]